MNEGANTSFMFAEGRIVNSIPKGHFWPITMQIYMSYQLWLLQERVKTVEAEDLKIKYSPDCNQNNEDYFQNDVLQLSLQKMKSFLSLKL